MGLQFITGILSHASAQAGTGEFFEFAGDSELKIWIPAIAMITAKVKVRRATNYLFLRRCLLSEHLSAKSGISFSSVSKQYPLGDFP